MKNQEKLRDGLILAYMVGNALTFANVISQGQNGNGAEAVAGQLLIALALSLVWPFYWIWRTAVG